MKGEKELGEYLETDDESCNYPFPPISWGSSSPVGECYFVCTFVLDQHHFFKKIRPSVCIFGMPLG